MFKVKLTFKRTCYQLRHIIKDYPVDEVIFMFSVHFSKLCEVEGLTDPTSQIDLSELRRLASLPSWWPENGRKMDADISIEGF